MVEAAGISQKNATSLVLFGVSYFIIFGILLAITGLGTFTFSLNEILTIAVASASIAVGVGAIAATLASTKIFGVGIEGDFIWKAALFALVVVWASYFVAKLTNLMPIGTPWMVSVLFIAPPLIGLLWGMFSVFLRSAG